MRVFLDANILLALANPNSHTRLLVDVLLAYHHECISNAYAVEEARRNLVRVAPQFSPDLEAFLPKLEMVDRLVSKLEISIKSKDIPIIYGAVVGKATHLLIPKLLEYGSILV